MYIKGNFAEKKSYTFKINKQFVKLTQKFAKY